MENPKTKKIGIVLFILSWILFLFLLAVPFLPLGNTAKWIVSGAVLIAAEAAFWISLFILGKEVMRKYGKKLNPLHWFRKREKAPKEPPSPTSTHPPSSLPS